MYTIRKKFRFEMAHQLDNAYSTCCTDSIHGHSYVLELFFRSEELDHCGMVIDFGAVSDEVIGYIRDNWDHKLILPIALSRYFKCIAVSYNPTAENMAKAMFKILNLRIPQLFKVRLHETETGYAEYEES